MKQLKIVMIVILSILCCIFTWTLVRGLNGKGFPFSSDWNMDGGPMGELRLIQENTFSSDEIQSIAVDYKRAGDDIIFLESQDDQIHIKEYYAGSKESPEAEISQRNGVLKVKCGRNKRYIPFFGFSNEYGSVEIYLPKRYTADISAYTAGGDIQTECDLKADGDISFSSVSGDIQCLTIEADRIDIATTSGDITGKSMKAKRTEVSTTSAEIKIQYLDTDTVDLSSVSGDIEIGDGRMSGSISTTSGEVDVNAGICGNIEVSTVSGEVNMRLQTKSDYRIKTSTVSGSVAIPSGHDKTAEYGIEVSTVSGDITIE